MSDKLEKALLEMKAEDVDVATLEAARARVWENVTNASATCAEFRQDFSAYLRNELSDGRRLLVEDHLSRCPGCRARIAEMKGGRVVVAMPQRSSSRWLQWGGLAAAAALLLSVLYLGRDAIDGFMAPGGPRATVVSVKGGLYRLPVGGLETGAAIGDRESVRTGPGAHAVLRLADGSMMDINERTELYVRRHHRQGCKATPGAPESAHP
jgi:putative zinc finger protein